jgi:flagellar P-ring protein FlgI
MYTTTLFALLTLFTQQAQAPAAETQPAASGTEEQPITPVQTPGYYLSGIEAPEQPKGKSSSEVTRTPRFQPLVGKAPLSVNASPIKSLVTVRGTETNHVMGIGLVTGLAGTGDSGEAAKQLLQNLLLTRNINLPVQALSSKNIAVVRVEASVPAGCKPGQLIDVRVSTIGDAGSLYGGTLAMTELTDITGQHVYATASGSITVGGFQAGGKSATATKNHVTVGTLPSGGTVQREIPTTVVSEHGYIYLDIKVAHDTFGNVVNIAEAINRKVPAELPIAQVTGDGKTVKIHVPQFVREPEYIAFLNNITSQEVETDNLARVIVNERSGVIVMGGDVRLRPGAITSGNLTVTVAETPETSQPGGLSQGQTTTNDRTQLEVEEENNGLVLNPGAATLQEVVEVLNVLGTTPRDMITILQAMSQGGLLIADIRRM